ncbi:TlpA disulfide reductase family protein [Azohydromonas aeria]|uniref:TlpA disulfide reductase family protein n=1 Tax=Azohydromonas aeria TaxID=2590212 RepID=UPI0012F99BC8
MKLRRPVVAVAAALALAAGVLAWQSMASLEPAPEVSYTLLDGSSGTTSSLKGKVVLVNFWATSCTTCVAEMPQIVATHNKFKDRGFETLAVAMSYDPPAYVSRFAQTRQLPFGVAIDNTGQIAKRFGDIQLTPTTFLLDQQGRIVKRYVGQPDFAALHVLVEDLLKKG